MVTGNRSVWPLALVVVLVFAGPAFANSIAPTAYFWPGVLPLTLGLAVPASVLAAVLERPFVTWAGIRHGAMRHSLEANAVSLIIGFVTLPIGLPALYTIGPLWSPVAVAISVVSERWYLRACCRVRVRWVPIILGNLLSSALLLLLPHAALEIKLREPRLLWAVEPYHTPLWWTSVTLGIVAFVVCFARTIWLVRREPPQDVPAATPTAEGLDRLAVATAARRKGRDGLLPAVQELLSREWDPMCLNLYSQARDEYNAYAPPLVHLLLAGTDEAELASRLSEFQREYLGLPAVDEQSNRHIARRLLGLASGTTGEGTVE